MSTLKLYRDKLLIKNDKLATSLDCCCDDACPDPAANGINDPAQFGWTKKPTKANNSITATFSFENSFALGCQGNNQNRQTGTATCSFYIRENRQVTLQIQGNVEGQSSGYDYGWIIINGPGVPPTDANNPRNIDNHVAIYSTQDNNLCDMFNASDDLQMNIGPGEYSVEFYVDTFDELYHKNMVHNFSVTW